MDEIKRGEMKNLINEMKREEILKSVKAEAIRNPKFAKSFKAALTDYRDNVDMEKGTYKNNEENRKLGRVGGQYGGVGEDEEPKKEKSNIETVFKNLQKDINAISKLKTATGELYLASELKVANYKDLNEQGDLILSKITTPEGFKRSENNIYRKSLNIYISFEMKH